MGRVMATRVLLADDQSLLVDALATILCSKPDIDVVARAHNGIEAVEAARMHRVDVAVLDIRMPRMDGIAAAKALMAFDGSIRVVMLTTFDDEELVSSALQAGVHGFLLKDSDPDVLISTVRAVAAGESVLSTKVTGPVLEAYRKATNSFAQLSAEQRAGLERATERELEVLRLVAQGLTNAEISSALHVAGTTVKTHVSALLSKLHARDRVALVLIAHRAGVVSS